MADSDSKSLVATNASSMVHYNSRCSVCTSSTEIVLFVNRMLVAGAGPTEVVRAVKPLTDLIKMRPFTVGVIKRHYDNDFNFQHKALREIVRRRATSLEEVEGEGVTRVMNAITLSELIMAKSAQQVLEPDAVITPTDGLNAAKLHAMLTKDEDSQIELAEINAQFARVISAVQSICTPEQMEAIVALVDQAEALELEAADVLQDESERVVTINGTD